MARTVFRFLNRTGSNLTLGQVTGNPGWEPNRAPPDQIVNNNQNAAIFVSNVDTPPQGQNVQFSFRYNLPGNGGAFVFDVMIFHNRTEIISDPPGQHVVNSETAGEFPDISYSATLQ